MFDAFLNHAGKKMKVLAKVTLVIALILTVALIFVGVGLMITMSSFWLFLACVAGALLTMLAGWIIALTYQCLGEAAIAAEDARAKAGSDAPDTGRIDVRNSWLCSCGTRNNASQSKCTACGEQKPRRCPNCGAEIHNGQTTCGRCGTPW